MGVVYAVQSGRVDTEDPALDLRRQRRAAETVLELLADVEDSEASDLVLGPAVPQQSQHPTYDREIAAVDARLHGRLKGDPGYEAIQAIHGVGKVFAAVFVAEIGDVGRFDNPRRLCSWAGLTPRHRESDTSLTRGSITKQGSRLVRWAAVEAVVKGHGGDPIKDHFRRVAERRGLHKGRVAAARKLLTLVFYGLRDGEIRCLAQPGTAA